MATNPDGSSFKPLFFYEIYEVNNETFGTKLTHQPGWILEKRYEIVYHFRGREADYWVASHDHSFTRDDALKFAIDCHAGRLRKITVDLSGIGR